MPTKLENIGDELYINDDNTNTKKVITEPINILHEELHSNYPNDQYSRVKAVSLDTGQGYTHIAFMDNKGNIWGRSSYTTGTHPFNFGSALATGFRQLSFPGENGTIIKWGTSARAIFILFDTGNLWVMGHAEEYLGLGSVITVYVPTLTATNVREYFVALNDSYDINYPRTFIVKNDDTTWSCGYNGYGQLGTGGTTTTSTWTQIVTTNFQASEYVTNIFVNGNRYGSTFFETNQDRIYVCGYNGYGQYGNNTTTQQNTPIDITSNWISAGEELVSMHGQSAYYSTAAYAQTHTLMIFRNTSTGVMTVRGAGNNTWNAFGDGTTTQRNLPVDVFVTSGTDQIVDFNDIGGAPSTVTLLLDTGVLWGWGYNSFGQLGDGTTTGVGLPKVLSVPSGTVSKILNYGQATHTYSYQSTTFVKGTNGLIYSAGWGTQGQRGDGDTTQNKTYFTQVLYPNDVDIVEISSFGPDADLTYLSLASDGSLYIHGSSTGNAADRHQTGHLSKPVLVSVNY